MIAMRWGRDRSRTIPMTQHHSNLFNGKTIIRLLLATAPMTFLRFLRLNKTKKYYLKESEDFGLGTRLRIIISEK